VFGWDQSQARTWNGICRHTALAALAQLRCAAIRGALTASIQLPHPDPVNMPSSPITSEDLITPDDLISDADLHIPLGDAPVPDHGGKPCPPGIAAIKLSIAETARLTRLATQYNTPPALSAGHDSRSRCAGHNDADATKPSPAGTTTTPDSSPQPGSQPQPKGSDAM
jgi:hypothetical protein